MAIANSDCKSARMSQGKEDHNPKSHSCKVQRLHQLHHGIGCWRACSLCPPVNRPCNLACIAVQPRVHSPSLPLWMHPLGQLHMKLGTVQLMHCSARRLHILACLSARSLPCPSARNLAYLSHVIRQLRQCSARRLNILTCLSTCSIAYLSHVIPQLGHCSARPLNILTCLGALPWWHTAGMAQARNCSASSLACLSAHSPQTASRGRI